MTLPDFLTEWPDGEIVLTGHRIGLYHLVTYSNAGYSSERLHEQFPTLPVSLIQQVLQFHTANRAEVDAYVAGCQATIDRQRDAGRHVDVVALRKRFAEVWPNRARALGETERP
jgi:uncharacterized protein (DUF433 family)